jgi:hypothetical protein
MQYWNTIAAKKMSKKTKVIEVVIGEKEDDLDPTRTIEGTNAPRTGPGEVGGHLAERAFFFECPWCGAINHAVESWDYGVYVCFACGKPMRPALA